MLRMYSDSICYESPEVACITGAGTSLRVPGKISVPIVAKHIHLLALFSFPFRLSFTIKSSTFPKPLSSPSKNSQSLPISRYYRFYITTNTQKRGKGGKYSAQKNKTWLEKYLTPSWRYCTLVNEFQHDTSSCEVLGTPWHFHNTRSNRKSGKNDRSLSTVGRSKKIKISEALKEGDFFALSRLGSVD